MHRGYIENLSVVLARIQIPVLALGQDDLLLVVSQFQRRCVVSALKVLGADLPAKNACLSPILSRYAQSNLVEDELGLLLSVHGTERLHLQLAQYVTGSLDITIVVLLQVGQNLGDAGTLNLNEYLALGDCAQGLDDLDLSVDIRDITEEVDDGLDHLLYSLLELAMFLGQHGDLVAENIPIAGGLAESNDSNEESGSGCKIGGLQITISVRALDKGMVSSGTTYLTRLLFEERELLDGTLQVGLRGKAASVKGANVMDSQ